MRSFLVLVFLLGSCNYKLEDSTIVKILNNNTDVPMFGKAFCQSSEDAKSRGGRLCYYVYTYPQLSAGTLTVGYAVQLNKDGTAKEIYIALTKNSKNNYVHIGGFFDPVDGALIKLDESNRHGIEVRHTNDYLQGKNGHLIEYFTPELYKDGKIIEKKDFVNDPTFIDTAIRELKEEAGWNVSHEDFLTEKLPISYRKHSFKDQAKTHLTFVAALSLGKVDNYGNLSLPQKNINFKSFKAPGYDDIEVVYLFPLSKINFKKTDDQPIDMFTVPPYFAEALSLVMPDILDDVLKKYNQITLSKVLMRLNKRGHNIDKKELVGNNLVKILKATK